MSGLGEWACRGGVRTRTAPCMQEPSPGGSLILYLFPPPPPPRVYIPAPVTASRWAAVRRNAVENSIGPCGLCEAVWLL